MSLQSLKPLQIGVVMDSIQSITIEKDTTFAILLEAMRRHFTIHYMEIKDLFLQNGDALATTQLLTVQDDSSDWFSLGQKQTIDLGSLDFIFMRKDPPVDLAYIHTTQLLSLAQQKGARVVNNPQSLRDANEKLFATHFPHCMPPTLVSSQEKQLIAFIHEQHDIVIKPLDGMGGENIFRVQEHDSNTRVIIENLTQKGQTMVMAQRYIPEIRQGDKRILLINGEPIPYALARIPLAGETRGNLAAGGQGVGVELTARDRWICEQIAPQLRAMGLWFVGIDVIGDYLTEINITSPTCVRQLDKHYQLNIAGQLFDALIKH